MIGQWLIVEWPLTKHSLFSQFSSQNMKRILNYNWSILMAHDLRHQHTTYCRMGFRLVLH